MYSQKFGNQADSGLGGLNQERGQNLMKAFHVGNDFRESSVHFVPPRYSFSYFD